MKNWFNATINSIIGNNIVGGLEDINFIGFGKFV